MTLMWYNISMSKAKPKLQQAKALCQFWAVDDKGDRLDLIEPGTVLTDVRESEKPAWYKLVGLTEDVVGYAHRAWIELI